MPRCRLSRRLERKHFRVIAESSASWEDWLSPEGRLLWVSPAVSRITGYTPDECLAMRDYPFEIVHPDDREPMRALLREALNGDPSVEAEFRVARKDGQMLWCAVSWQRVADLAPHLRGLRSSIRDIGWRKHVEQQLEGSGNELRAIYGHAPVLLCTLDADRRVLRANKAFVEFTGVPMEELLNGRACGVFGCINAHDDPRGCGFGGDCADCRLRQAIEDTLATGREHREVEYRATIGKGEKRGNVMLLGSTVRVHGAERLQVLLCLQDMTERDQIKASLQASEERFRMLFQKAPIGIALADSGSVLREANESMCRMLGYARDELVGKTVDDITHPTDRPLTQALTDEVLRRERPGYRVEKRYVRRDGGTIWASVTTAPVFGPAGELLYGIGMVEDITDRKDSETALSEKEQRLRDAQLKLRSLAEHLLSAREEERRKIAQEIHDELGQALTALKMDLHWIERRIEPSQEPVHKKMQSMAALIEQTILKVQRISSDLRPRMLDDLGLPPALEWLGGDFSRRTGIRCDVSVEVTESRIGGNSATTIFRVVQEALTNVARHARASRVSVTLREVGETLDMAIADDGVGISRDQATGPRSFGLIGLRERVLTLGGEISIRGEPGRGTTVAVSIPYPGGGDLA